MIGTFHHYKKMQFKNALPQQVHQLFATTEEKNNTSCLEKIILFFPNIHSDLDLINNTAQQPLRTATTTICIQNDPVGRICSVTILLLPQVSLKMTPGTDFGWFT